MPFYTCNTPLKVLVSVDPLVTKIVPETESVELTEADAEGLLANGAISGPVADPVAAKSKK